MGWNGTGTFNLTYTWPNDAANGIPITDTRMQTQEQDMAGNGFGNCITRDGQGKASASQLPDTDNAYDLGGAGAAWKSGYFGTSIGIGMTPINILDITLNQNQGTRAQITNSDTGTAAYSSFRANNGTALCDFAMLGSSFTGFANYAQIGSTHGILLVAANSYPVIFQQNGNESARFGTDGSFLVGTTTDGGWTTAAKAEIKSGGLSLSVYSTGTGSAAQDIRVDDSTTNFAAFYYSTAAVGTISTNGTTTSYNTSSDQRLKKNITDAPDPSSIIDSLQVRQWDWKSNNAHESFGFVAQEEIFVAPFAVTAGDADPNTITKQWQRDDSKLVPLLVKEIQLLRARVAALEAK